MELRKFISSALLDILNGVADAQSETKPGTIIPEVTSSYESVKTGISELTSVEFEVTVKADEHAGSEAKLNVVAAFIGGGIKGESGNNSGHSAKLTFKVPIRYPISVE